MCVEEAVRQQVNAELTKLENEANIRILFAVESGSRAWGFPSPNSDYDVRFVFMRPYTAYMSISEQKESLVFPITDDLDIDGWDIKKVLRHVRKSNPVIFEWLQSPVIYKRVPRFAEKLRQTALPYFSPYAGLYHYLGLVKNFYEYLQESDTIKIKRLFYILRPLLAAWWIIEKKTVPPMEFSKLLTVLPECPIGHAGPDGADSTDGHDAPVGPDSPFSLRLKSAIHSLLNEKATAEEGKLVRVPPLLIELITQMKRACESYTGFAPARARDTSALDQFFLTLLEDFKL